MHVSKQVELLQSRGLIVPDPDRAARYLLSIGYYRFSAYCIPFELLHGKVHQFKDNATFDEILALYIFDRELRCLFWEALERVEIHIRTQWVYNLVTLTQDPFAHLNPNNFLDLESHQQSLDKLKIEVNRSKKETFVRHFFDHYEGEFPPLWACVHLMTLGELIRWVENTKSIEVRNGIAQSLGFQKFYPFSSFAVALTELRNVCAHHVRLWNRSFMKRHATVKFLGVPGFEDILPVRSSNKLYSLAILLAASLKAHNPNTSWPKRLRLLLETRTSQQIHAMGFPPDWAESGVWNKVEDVK